LRCIFGSCLPCFLVSSHRVGQPANGLPLLGDRPRLLACHTNYKMGFLLAICVYSFYILHCLEPLGLAVYLAWLTRLRLVLARRKRLAVGVGWLVIMPG